MQDIKSDSEVRGKNFQSLSGFLPEGLLSFCNLDKKFRSEQIFSWIAKGAVDFDAMTNLSLSLRQELSEKFHVYSTRIDKELKDPDGTVKLVIELFDGAKVESVLLIDKSKRKTACISCQVGCPLKCAFCKTGQLGFLRNLSASEIVEEFFWLESRVGQLDNIVFMGMGEPMLNFDEILKAIEILSHPKGRSFSKRRVTISTSGLCSGIHKMADLLPEVRLAVSLTTATEDLRRDLMPIAKVNPLPKLKEAIRYFNDHSSRRVTLEMALMHNVNTSKESAQAVINFAKGLNCHINLIPWNPIEELDFETPTKTELQKFENQIKRAGLNATLRQKRGQTIGGACGQLGSIKQKKTEDSINKKSFLLR